jgi:hypothetical protein
VYLAYKHRDIEFVQKLFLKLQVDLQKKLSSTVAVFFLREFQAQTPFQNLRSLDLIKSELRRKKLIGDD